MQKEGKFKQIQQQLDDVAARKLSREDFLKMSLGVVIAILGARQITEGLQAASRHKSPDAPPVSKSSGYGNSPYGV